MTFGMGQLSVASSPRQVASTHSLPHSCGMTTHSQLAVGTTHCRCSEGELGSRQEKGWAKRRAVAVVDSRDSRGLPTFTPLLPSLSLASLAQSLVWWQRWGMWKWDAPGCPCCLSLVSFAWSSAQWQRWWQQGVWTWDAPSHRLPVACPTLLSTTTSMPKALQTRAQHGGSSGGWCENGKPPAATIPLSSAHQLAQLPAQLSLQPPHLVVPVASWPSGIVLQWVGRGNLAVAI